MLQKLKANEFQWILFLGAYLKREGTLLKIDGKKFQWILFLGAYLKIEAMKGTLMQVRFQWILFLGAYLKLKQFYDNIEVVVSVDTIPWGLLKEKVNTF